MNSTFLIPTAPYSPMLIQNVYTHIIRTLSGKGTILSSLGQEVSPFDIIARFCCEVGFFSINLSRKLSESPDKASKFLLKKNNQKVYKGELLAIKKGLFSKISLTCPTDGIIQGYDTTNGLLRIKFFPKEISLISGVYGIIDHIDRSAGQIYIKTLAHKLYGKFGIGKARMGSFKSVFNISDFSNPTKILPKHNQSIIFAGSLVNQSTINKALRSGVTGIIASGIDYNDFHSFQTAHSKDQSITDPGITILIFNGFGASTLPVEIYKLLKTYENDYIYLDGFNHTLVLPTATKDSAASIRKTAIPISAASNEKLSLKELKAGQNVCLISPSLLGITGKILSIDKTPTVLESGVSSIMLTIETPYRKIRVPFQNVEII